MHAFMAIYSLASPEEKNLGGALFLPLSSEPPALAICVVGDVESAFHFLTSGNDLRLIVREYRDIPVVGSYFLSGRVAAAM